MSTVQTHDTDSLQIRSRFGGHGVASPARPSQRQPVGQQDCNAVEGVEWWVDVRVDWSGGRYSDRQHHRESRTRDSVSDPVRIGWFPSEKISGLGVRDGVKIHSVHGVYIVILSR